MKFFLPLAKDAETAEKDYSAIKENAERHSGWKTLPHRYFSIDYMHKGRKIHNEVGKEDPETRELVFAIFGVDGGPFLVCTTHRGVLSGSAMMANEDATPTLFEKDQKP
ncbi:hypothetical protein [Bradyrhizobium sp. SZCCHNS3004]|uniref:hypothetical protein n=1 Tax=Bradyrhizobium sp. SZCCHNS3004 TaxID=3057312 RepID=UPI00291654F4|nr:hypothetical protein [Bradyrhizobium sp. SZCCHNS3004]